MEGTLFYQKHICLYPIQLYWYEWKIFHPFLSLSYILFYKFNFFYLVRLLVPNFVHSPLCRWVGSEEVGWLDHLAATIAPAPPSGILDIQLAASFSPSRQLPSGLVCLSWMSPTLVCSTSHVWPPVCLLFICNLLFIMIIYLIYKTQ